MKIGIRNPSINKSINARTKGKVTRVIKSNIPGYGRKGTGYVKNPKRALYNKVYSKTTFSGVGSISSLLLIALIIYMVYKIFRFIAPFIMIIGLILMFYKNTSRFTKLIGAFCLFISMLSPVEGNRNIYNFLCILSFISGLYFLASADKNKKRITAGIVCFTLWGLFSLMNF